MEISEFSTEKIEDIRVPWVICGICKQKRSGILHIMGSNKKLGRRLFFSNGALQFASSNMEGDRLGQLLLSAGRISSEQLETAMFRAAQGMRFGKVLVDTGSVNQKEINYFVGMQIRNILFSTFELEDGLYFFEEKPIALPKDLQLKVLVGHLILNGLRRMKNLILVFDEVSKIQNRKLTQGTEPLFPLHEMPLTQNEAFLYSRLDGRTTVDDLIKITNQPREMVYKFVYAGLCLEFISVREGSRSVSINRFDSVFRKREKGDGDASKESKGGTKHQRELRARIIEKVSEISKVNFWQFLEVKEGALEEDVHKKYLQLSQEFHPDLFQDLYFDDLLPSLNKVISFLNLAYHTLKDPKAMEKYEEKLRSQRESEQLSLKEKQKTAEGIFRKGMNYYLDDDFFNAHRHFEWALKYFPKNAAYWCAKGKTEMKNPQWFGRAKVSLFEAIKLDKYYDEPLVVLAEIAIQEDDIDKAQDFLRKALDLNPMNEQAMDLQEKLEQNSPTGFLSKFKNKRK